LVPCSPCRHSVVRSRITRGRIHSPRNVHLPQPQDAPASTKSASSVRYRVGGVLRTPPTLFFNRLTPCAPFCGALRSRHRSDVLSSPGGRPGWRHGHADTSTTGLYLHARPRIAVAGIWEFKLGTRGRQGVYSAWRLLIDEQSRGEEEMGYCAGCDSAPFCLPEFIAGCDSAPFCLPEFIIDTLRYNILVGSPMMQPSIRPQP
jgi:hypothetical protein